MLDSLGSTLTRTTMSSFFTRFDKKALHDDITIDQAIQCLEAELGRPESEKKRLDADDGLPDLSISATPVLSILGDKAKSCNWIIWTFQVPQRLILISTILDLNPLNIPLSLCRNLYMR